VVCITSDPINVQEILTTLLSPRSDGASVLLGSVRDHSHGRRVRGMEFGVTSPAAEGKLADVESEIRAKWVVDDVALVHRVGLMRAGEISVLAAVSAPHRAEAFAACQFALDRIAAIVPIWKKPHFEEGLEWITGQHDLDVAGTPEGLEP
jgi:molybdopterin synthase catalytic subunit